MDVFLMVRRDKQTIFIDATEEVTVLQLKKKLDPIVKKSPEDQRLYNIDTNEALEDNKTLGEYGYKAVSARAQDPSTIGLAFRTGDDAFEEGNIKSYSIPPELPDVMRSQEGTVPPVGLSTE